MTSNNALAAETALPQRVTQHHDVRLIWLSIIRSKRSAHDRIDPEHRKEIRRGNLRGNFFRLAVTRELRVPIDERGHVFENMALLFPIKEIAEVDHILLVGIAAAIVFPNHDQSIGVTVRQGTH